MRDRPRLLFVLLLGVNVLNLADFLLTLNVLARGGGEANPILRSLFAMDPLYAGGFKLVAVLLTCWLAWRCRRFRSGLEAAVIMLVLFTVVICYHIFGLIVVHLNRSDASARPGGCRFLQRGWILCRSLAPARWAL